jgi:hypothetical protein
MPLEEMRRAIEHGDTETVQLEMVNIADINHAIFYVAELDSSLTALQLAVYLGQINVVIFLLNKGVAVDSLSLEKENWSQWGARLFTFGIVRRSGRFT